MRGSVTDYAHSLWIVRNRTPKPGEQAIYSVPPAPNDPIGYIVIAFLPNPSRSGGVLSLTGTDSDATGSAAGFRTSEEQTEKFREALHVGRFPYFEAPLKTSRLSCTFFDANLIAFRTYPGPH